MKKTAVFIILFALISKVLGFFRDILLSYFYGASPISDAYLISQIIPSTIFGLIAAGIATSYIPVFSRVVNEKTERSANLFNNNVVNFLMILSTIIILGVGIFTEPLVKVFASGFTDESFELAVRFTRISIIGIYFTGLIFLFSGFLQFKDSFLIVALSGIPLNLIFMLSIALSSKMHSDILPIGYVIALAVQFAVLVPLILKKGYRYRTVFDVKDRYMKSILLLAMPVILGTSVDQVNVLVDMTLASRISVGGVTALSYASRLNYLIQGIFVLSIATLIFPQLSRMASVRNIDGIKDSLKQSIVAINLLVIPTSILMLFFSQEIVELLFGRGAFDGDALVMTTQALFFYTIGMIGIALREILSKVFYALEDTKTPMINAAIAMVLNIVLNLILSRYMGIGGLALASSIAALIAVWLMARSLKKKIGVFADRALWATSGKILLVSLASVALAKTGYVILGNGNTIALIGFLAVAGIVYVVILFVSGIKELEDITRLVQSKIGRK
ncbi:murein biosynthesis integral membrane protein MurJ [Planococcus sp. YIM B11945]|uniref:murein biosynthesis integral membrane protein MurJ n=1 Tax=Planococcus sp. YIM B11945 TaxID=3435410 RepID=UPI003D7C9BD7